MPTDAEVVGPLENFLGNIEPYNIACQFQLKIFYLFFFIIFYGIFLLVVDLMKSVSSFLRFSLLLRVFLCNLVLCLCYFGILISVNQNILHTRVILLK